MSAKSMKLPKGCLLTLIQVEYVRRHAVPAAQTLPCRFLKAGQAVDLLSGDMASKGSNVMYHPVYWNMTPKIAATVAGWTDTKVVFSE